MYYRSLNAYLSNPMPRIENDLQHRQTATIAEREEELQNQIQSKTIFYGGQLEDKLNKRFQEFEDDLTSIIDEKLELLETKIKLQDLYQDEEDDDSSSDEEPETEPETEPESEPETDDDSSDEENDAEMNKQEQRKKYMKDYHRKYYLKNKADKLKRQIKQQ